MYCVIIIFLLIFCVVDGKINGEMENDYIEADCRQKEISIFLASVR